MRPTKSQHLIEALKIEQKAKDQSEMSSVKADTPKKNIKNVTKSTKQGMVN